MRVFVMSNHVFAREGLRHCLSSIRRCEVVGCSDVADVDAQDLVSANADVVVLDLAGLSSGPSILRKLRKNNEKIQFVVFCPTDTAESAVDALDAGAAGILTQSCQTPELERAITRVLQGDNYMQPDIAMAIYHELRAKETKRVEAERLRLTYRENQVVTLLMQGKTNRQIGEMLSISDKTVKHYVGVLKGKFSAANRLEIVLQAQRLEL